MPIYASAQRYLLEPLLQVDYAHTVMLARQGIIPLSDAALCIHALDSLNTEKLRRTSYDGHSEDLFFIIQARLALLCGEEAAGKMHTARSRNDIDVTIYRVVLRDRVISQLAASLELRCRLLELASQHRAALMPAYTHGQPAQPTTLGHYLMACVEALERDAERLIAAFGRLNRNPLGACAITTTGFPIDREMTARLLGFRGLQVNSYGAIASVDYLTECCSALVVSMLSLGRFAQDLLLWSTAEFGFLRLSDAYVQISSIMPQKRNPVPLEHVRILASRAMMGAQSVFGCLHNTPFTDINDAADQIQPLAYSAFEDGERALLLLAGLLGETEFDLPRMRFAADRNFLPVTELADSLVRTAGISFRLAHEIVSGAVRELSATDAVDDQGICAAAVIRALRSLHDGACALSDEQVCAALSAENFVAVRGVVGGPAPSALDPEIRRAQQQLHADKLWLDEVRVHLETASALLRQECDRLLRP